MRKILLMILAGTACLLNSCGQKVSNVLPITVFPDSIISDVSNHPVGVNLNFLMDGGRFPEAETNVAGAVKKLGTKYLRYPGGEKSDFYFFSVSPYETSHPTLCRTAGLDNYPGMFKDGNFVYDPLDFDEFIHICREVGAEPVLVVAADRYLDKIAEGERVSTRQELLNHAVEWVRYANIKKKYNVRYWMIGNESWNKNNENSTAEIYAQDVIDFSKAMKTVDPSILIVPNGDSDEFFKTVITKAGDYIDRLCVSNYGVFDFNSGYESYKDTTRCLIWPAQTALNAMNKYATPEQLAKWKLIVAEYGTIDWAKLWQGTNDMGHAIVNFDMTGQLLLEPQIEFSCFWNTRWPGNEKLPQTDHDAIDSNGNINPTGYSLLIWNRFMGDKMIKSESKGYIISYASYSPQKDQLFVYLINKGDREESVNIVIPGKVDAKVVQCWEYFGKDDKDLAPVWQQRDVKDKDITLKKYSITVIESKLTEG